MTPHNHAGQLLFAIQERVPVGEISLRFHRDAPTVIFTYTAAINGNYRNAIISVDIEMLSTDDFIDTFAYDLSRRFNYLYHKAAVMPETLPTITVGLAKENRE